MATFTATVAGVPTVATFRATIRGSRQEAGDYQSLTVGVVLDTSIEWWTMQTLLTTKYHLHVPLSGVPVLDIVRGPGEGDLDIDGLGITTAVLTSLERSTYTPTELATGSANFLITGDIL